MTDKRDDMLSACDDLILREKIRKQIFKLIKCGDFEKLGTRGDRGKDGEAGAGILIERLSNVDIILTGLNNIVSKQSVNITMEIPRDGLFFTCLRVFRNSINGVIFDLGDRYLFQLFDLPLGGSLSLQRDPIFTYSFSSAYETVITNDLVFTSPLGDTFYSATGTFSYSNNSSSSGSDIVVYSNNISNKFIVKSGCNQFLINLTQIPGGITFVAILLGVYSQGASSPITIKADENAKSYIPIIPDSI